jgi:hypothetical protein
VRATLAAVFVIRVPTSVQTAHFVCSTWRKTFPIQLNIHNVTQYGLTIDGVLDNWIY